MEGLKCFFCHLYTLLVSLTSFTLSQGYEIPGKYFSNFSKKETKWLQHVFLGEEFHWYMLQLYAAMKGWNSSSGADVGGMGGLFFFLEKNCAQARKYNINKIYQIKPRLKEVTCLITIAETKKTFSAFQFFHKQFFQFFRYFHKRLRKVNRSSASLVTWKSWNYENLLHRYVVSKKQ